MSPGPALRRLAVPLVVLGALLAVNLLVLGLWTWPAWRQGREARLALAAAESRLHGARQRLRELEIRGGDVLAAAADVEEFVASYTRDVDQFADVLAYLRSEAAAAGVRLERSDHTFTAVQGLELVRLETSVVGAGSYAAVKSWLGRLHQGPAFGHVLRLDLTGGLGSALGVEATAGALLRPAGPGGAVVGGTAVAALVAGPPGADGASVDDGGAPEGRGPRVRSGGDGTGVSR